MLHAQSAGEGCIGFYHDVVLLAVGSELGSCIEGVDFDLVDCGLDARVAGQQFVELSLLAPHAAYVVAVTHTCFSPKFETPPILTSPSWIASSIARQLSSLACFPPYGLCSRNKST